MRSFNFPIAIIVVFILTIKIGAIRTREKFSVNAGLVPPIGPDPGTYIPLSITESFSTNSHVVLTPEVTKLLPKNRLLSETEWRAMGVQQSRGWVHYAIHRPEPHIMLFRRPLNYQAP